MNVKLWAALCVAAGLCASGAQAQTLVYSESGTLPTSGDYTLNLGINLPADVYSQPARIDPTENPFRSSMFGPVQIYTIVLTTDATATSIYGYQHDIIGQSYWQSGVSSGVDKWLESDGGDQYGGDRVVPTIVGNTITWSFTTIWMETTSGCEPDALATCSQIIENLFDPAGFSIDPEFLEPAGAAWSFQVYADNVPEPPSWLLMVAGVGLTGAALRRQQRAPFANA